MANDTMTGVNPSKEEMIVTEEKRSSDGRRRVDRRKPAEKAENWLAEERRQLDRRDGERRLDEAQVVSQ
jgi:hypothetical protein